MTALKNMLKMPVAAALLAGTALAAQPAVAAGLTVARSVDADGLDIHKVSTTQSMQVTNLLFDTLLTMDRSGGIHPGLASGYTLSEDGKTYVFTIRDGLKCHDGSAFDAAAVKFNIDRALDPATVSPNASSWGPIDSVAVEGSTVTVTMKSPYGPFTAFLAGMQSGLMCPSSVAGAEFTPIGTGPFKLVSWTRNDRIELAANPDYVNFSPLIENPGKPHLDTLTIMVVPEAVARMAALRSGEVDMVEPSLEEAADLKDDDAFKVYAADLSGQQVFAAFTWKIAPLDNPNVRKAIGMAMNRDAYATIGFEGLVDVANCPVAPNLFATDEEKCASWGVSYDPEAAKALLAEAGYGPDKPLKVKLLVHKLQGWDQMHQIMQQDLAAIGVEAEIETREVAAFFDYMGTVNGKAEGEPAVWTMGMSGADPDYLYFLWKQPGFTNMGLSDTMDAELEAQRALSGDARAAKVQEIQQYLLENAYAVPLVSPGWGWLMASTAKVDGFKMGHMVTLLFNDVTVTE
ncbi:ABC transporter substrate-binding protein [Methylobrevis albus]|nr:ABC transporter substrate-binding protein [Methylobrevis albus]